MQLHNTICIGLLLGTLLSGCSWLNGKEDTVIISSLPKINNQFQPKKLWNYSIGNGSGKFYCSLHPAWQGNHLFVANHHGIVQALNVESGKKIWSIDLSVHTNFFSRNRPAHLSGGLTVAGSLVYVGSELAKVYAINTQDGNIAWETIVSGEALSTPVVSDGLVLIHTSNGMLQALNDTDGTIKWTINLGMPTLTLRGESSPTVILGIIIIGGDDGRISAYTINHGQLIWQQTISQCNGSTEITKINDVQTTPVVINGIVYVIAYNGKLTALDLLSGQVLWSQEIGSITNLLVDSNRIYLVDQNDYVFAVNAQNGIILWRQNKLIHRKLTSPVLYDSYVIAGDLEGYLYWLDNNDGRLVTQQRVSNTGFLTTPIVTGNKLIVQTINGEVYAITH